MRIDRMQGVQRASFDAQETAEALPLRWRAVGADRHWQALCPSGCQDLHVVHRIGRLGTLIAYAAGFRIGAEQPACEDPTLFRQPCCFRGTDSRKRLEYIVQAAADRKSVV